MWVHKETKSKLKSICDDNNLTMSEMLRLDIIRIIEEEPKRIERKSNEQGSDIF